MADHGLVTRAAMAALPERTRDVWAPVSDALAGEYCYWPDRWFNPEQYRTISPYMLVMNDLPFHYPPMSRPNYLYWMVDDEPTGPRMRPAGREPNEHWPFFRDGTRYYLEQIIADLHADRMDDAAKRMGILLHFFQDTHALHALEGPWGTDCFVLDHLVELPADSPYNSCLEVIAAAKCDACDVHGYAAQQEGASIDEAVLRLYARYVDSALANRLLHLPIVTAMLGGNEAEARAKTRELYDRLARLSVDVMQTVTALAMAWQPDTARSAALRNTYLDELAVIERPWIIPGPYRLGGMAWGHCRDAQGGRHPLAVRDAEGRVHEHTHGWGSGAHVAALPWQWEVPAGVYERLHGRVGLHATLGDGGDVTVTISLADKQLLCERLDARQPSVAIDLPVDQGGMLTLSAVASHGKLASANNLAWLGLRLVRSS